MAVPLLAQPVRPISPVTDGAGYRRYSAFACLGMADRVRKAMDGGHRVVWRGWWPDTATAANAPDSLAAAAIRRTLTTELRACLATHPLDRTKPEHLMGLGLAWLAANDMAQSRAAFERAVEVAAPVAERAYQLQQIVDAYLTASPEYISAALVFMTRLDALGPAAAGRRLAMHNRFYDVARELDSLPLMESQMRAALRTRTELAGDDRLQWKIAQLDAIKHQMDFLARRGQYTAAIAAAEQIKGELGAVDPALRSSLEDAVTLYRGFGASPPKIHASFVYRPGRPAPDTTFTPTPGRIALYVFKQYHQRFEENISFFSQLHNLIARVGPTIDVIVVDETTGWANDALIPSAREESKQIASFYQEYLKLPVTVAVFDAPVTGKLVDGSVIRGGNPNHDWKGIIVLIDQDGKLRDANGDGGFQRLRHLIADLSH